MHERMRTHWSKEPAGVWAKSSVAWYANAADDMLPTGALRAE